MFPIVSPRRTARILVLRSEAWSGRREHGGVVGARGMEGMEGHASAPLVLTVSTIHHLPPLQTKRNATMKLCSTRSSNHVLANLGVKDRCAFASTCKQYYKASSFFYAGLRDNEAQFVTELGLSWNYFDLTPFALNGKMLEKMDYWVVNG